ncbi:MAG: hypothetical protein H0X26_04235 [Alphaproteobacteria bacterium]|nr:hypothetical protein [Alphaproteobacteria bacterium]
MKDEKHKKVDDPSRTGPIKESEEKDYEDKKRAAYSAMGKLGGLARAKQMAEKGFAKENKPSDVPKKKDKKMTSKEKVKSKKEI